MTLTKLSMPLTWRQPGTTAATYTCYHMCLALFAGLLSSTVHANDFVNISLSVTVVEPACSLTAPEPVVMNPDARKLILDGQSDPIYFSLKLENCNGAPSKAFITFDGRSALIGGGVIALDPTSEAEGFGISIVSMQLDPDNPVTLKSPLVITLNSTSAQHELEFKAYAQSLCAGGSCLKAGAFSATATVELTYE
ncbi:fimbrial protein [Aeromonas salmonicida]